jgi:Flp pilus assembly protein TadG
MLVSSLSIFFRIFDKLREDQRGSIIMFVGLGLFVLVGATGIAVDMSRLQSAHSKLSNALDAAGLAAGAKAHSGDIEAIVDNYMAVNYPHGFMDSRITDINVNVNADNTIINLDATATVDMKFMQIFGIESLEIDASSEITRENKGLELVMVLDTTGSMYYSGKMGDLRAAATDMTNILFGNQESAENLYVALVPYVTTVNIGSDKTAWLRNYSSSLYPPEYPSGATKWKGCVEARGQWTSADGSDGLDVTDDPPNAADIRTLFPIYYWEDDLASNDWIRTETTGRGRRATTHTVVSLYEEAGYSYYSGRGPNIGCGNQVTPFTQSKTTILNAIDALTPWNRGGTMSSVGMAWGWRMISPRWRGLWGNPDLPLDYNTPLMSKAVIVMTDGINEVGYDYTSYDPINYQRLGRNVDTSAEGVTAINNKFLSLCTAMKARGILVYTLTFQLDNSSQSNNARTLFRNCATHPDFYFDSADGATLRQSFRTIGDSLANLMISR